MSLLIETIKLLDGKIYNPGYHEERMKRSLKALFKTSVSPDLEWLTGKDDFPGTGLYKCRIVYDDSSQEITFAPYELRSIRRVKVVEDNDISYSFKFADRSAIDRLFALRGDCDDVLIVRKGKVTDSSYSNVVFRKGDSWYTPDSPLLAGTMRERLIRENKVQAREILKGDIRSFDSLKFINAMLEFDGPEIEVSDIVF